MSNKMSDDEYEDKLEALIKRISIGKHSTAEDICKWMSEDTRQKLIASVKTTVWIPPAKPVP